MCLSSQEIPKYQDGCEYCDYRKLIREVGEKVRYSKYQTGPFPIRLWLEDDEIETMAFEQMDKAQIYPTLAKPYVDVDRVLEKNFSISPEFEDLEDNILGATEFFITESILC